MGLFFAAIEGNLADAREANRRQCIDFFNQLGPRLTAARELDRELNHHLAHRFNTFRYLRDDELGLSRIIADLLDPLADHGQGPLFLRLFLDKLELNSPVTDFSGTKVFVERSIEGNRRIDIYVEISSGDKSYGLAIENKPFDKDRKQQVKDYLDHLDKRFGEDQFHLIYLSPSGEPPGETSLPKDQYERWTKQFLIMPYHHQRTTKGAADTERKQGEFENFRAPCSLTEWLDACRTQCEAQRLRWFLSDAESYCRRTFGDADMASDLETNTVIELLESNPDHLETARIVYESWPRVRKRIFGDFLEHLRGLVEAKIKGAPGASAHDVCVKAQYDGEGRNAVNSLSIHRASWPIHQGKDSRTVIELRPGSGFQAWYGVWSPPNSDLESKLKAEFPDSEAPDSGYPVWLWVEKDRSDWHKIVSELHRETREGDGAITRYYVESLVEFAERAIPIISNVEGSQSSQN